MTTETQFMANCKSLFQQVESTLRYLEPKYSPEYADQGAFQGKSHILITRLAVARVRLHKQAV